MIKKIISAVILSGFIFSLKADFKPENISSFTLANGLKVLLYEDHSQSQIAHYTFFRVGSRNERPGLTGVSHFIEHMMFNGTEKYGPGAFDQIMENLGGANNAYTGQDFTAYTNWYPPQALEKMIELEADRMQGLLFQEDVLESERGVVASERRLSEDDDFSMLSELLQAVSIIAHPYHWSVIGWMSDILSWKREEIVAYYRTFYAPNNALLVICGDFKSSELKKLIEQYYGKIQPAALIPEVKTVEPEQKGERRVKLIRQSNSGILMIAYPGVKTADRDFYALYILSSVLTAGKGSRLHKLLVEQEQLAFRVSGYFEESFDPYLFFIVAYTPDAKNYQKIEQLIEEEISLIARNGVTLQELEKVKNQKLAELYVSLQTLAGKANSLGQAEMLYNDFRKIFTLDKELEAVKAEDLQKVAGKYLLPAKKNVAELIPEGGEK